METSELNFSIKYWFNELVLKGTLLAIFAVCKDNKHKDVKLIHENNSSKIHKIELPRKTEKIPMKRFVENENENYGLLRTRLENCRTIPMSDV